MKVHRDDHPEMSLAEIKAQIAVGALTKEDIVNKIITPHIWSKYYLSKEVLEFLEEYLGVKIPKNKYLLRDEEETNGETK